MNKRPFSMKLLSRSGALTLGLLLAAANAFAHSNAAPGGVTLARGSSVHTTLMPVAPVSSRTFTSSEEDIRDIRQPRHLTAPWFWAAVAAGIIALAAAASALWRWIHHGKFFVMQPREIALQYLGEARRLMDPDQARDYCLELSKILRRYIEGQFHVHAAQLTTGEFLHEMMQSREALLPLHRALLGDFLEHCDQAKIAGWCYCRPDLMTMHDCATEFVRQTASNDNKNFARNNPPATRHAINNHTAAS